MVWTIAIVEQMWIRTGNMTKTLQMMKYDLEVIAGYSFIKRKRIWRAVIRLLLLAS